MRCLVLLLASFTLLVAVRAQSPLPGGLDEARLAYDHAQATGDRAALEHLLAPDYLILSSTGKLRDRAWLIESFCGAGTHNNPFIVQKPFTRILSPDSAILGGWAELSGTENGKPFSEKLRFADTWARHSGRWQVVFTSVAPAEAP